MPLYYRDYDRTGYPPISSEDLSLSFQQFATLSLNERMRFTQMHGGRPLGQTIPPKHIPNMDPLLYVGEGTTDYIHIERPPSRLSPRRVDSSGRSFPPLHYRKYTKRGVIHSLLQDEADNALLAAQRNQEAESRQRRHPSSYRSPRKAGGPAAPGDENEASLSQLDMRGPSRFILYQKELEVLTKVHSISGGCASSSNYSICCSPVNTLESTQEFVASGSMMELSSVILSPRCPSRERRSPHRHERRFSDVSRRSDSSVNSTANRRRSDEGPRFLLPPGCNPLDTETPEYVLPRLAPRRRSSFWFEY